MAGMRAGYGVAPMNIATIVEWHPDDAPALISRGHITTYAEMRRQAGELRGGLGRLGLTPGDRVAIVSANNWFFVVSYLAVVGAGGVAVPLNPASPARELAGQLRAVRATAGRTGSTGRPAGRPLDRARPGVDAPAPPA